MTQHRDKLLLDAARLAAASSYSPYSNFPVGAAVRTSTGNVFAGSNIENASYGLTVCGERVAIWNAVATGERAIEAVAVVALNQTGVTPCGACRQVMNEFVGANGDMTILTDTDDGTVASTTLSALLPHAFGPQSLR